MATYAIHTKVKTITICVNGYSHSKKLPKESQVVMLDSTIAELVRDALEELTLKIEGIGIPADNMRVIGK
jgi:hypothetical protein